MGPTGLKAVQVSFERPYASGWSQSPLFYEYPLVRFLERSGYDVSYTTASTWPAIRGNCSATVW